MSGQAMIVIKGLCKQFNAANGNSVEVLRDIDLDVPDRVITAVIGPSGAGKTTLSKCISLLEKPTSGSVLVNGHDLSSLTGAALREKRRAIGTIFQSSALLRRKTVAENVALPLEYLGVVKSDIDRRVADLLDHVGIAEKARHYPGQLSGGQKQRVGIARALALHPQVLLSDEATSGLDPEATESILTLLKNLRDELGLSVILITHEMDVVRKIADRVAVLKAGRIVESGSVRELIANPASAIGSQLLPIKPSVQTDSNLLTLQVAYGANADVPADWISQTGEALHARVHVLGGVIEQVTSRPAGRLLISLAFHPGAHANPSATVHFLRSLGLVVSVLQHRERIAEAALGVA
jgi:D-methionine transport system ATP-binding protein